MSFTFILFFSKYFIRSRKKKKRTLEQHTACQQVCNKNPSCSTDSPWHTGVVQLIKLLMMLNRNGVLAEENDWKLLYLRPLRGSGMSNYNSHRIEWLLLGDIHTLEKDKEGWRKSIISLRWSMQSKASMRAYKWNILLYSWKTEKAECWAWH